VKGVLPAAGDLRQRVRVDRRHDGTDDTLFGDDTLLAVEALLTPWRRSLAVTHLSAGRVVVVTPPASPAVTTAAARAHCRVAHAHHDATLASLVGVASAWLEGPTGGLGRSLVTRTLDLELAAFPCGREAALPCGPVSGAPVVTYRDADNVVQTLDAALYFVAGDTLVFNQGWAPPATYPRPDAVVVRYTAGYGDATALPPPVRQALLLLVGELYEPWREYQ